MHISPETYLNRTLKTFQEIMQHIKFLNETQYFYILFPATLYLIYSDNIF